MMKTLNIVIGRFQPYHKGHEAMIQHANELEGETVILIGSANKDVNNKNIMTGNERLRLMRLAWPTTDVLKLADFDYADESWEANLFEKLHTYIKEQHNGEMVNIRFVCGQKDLSERSAWTRGFPIVGVDTDFEFSATDIRCKMILGEDVSEYLPQTTINYFKSNSHILEAMKAHNLAMLNYKAKYGNGNHCTTDAVVRDSLGKILLIRRESGVLAIPGGFLEPNLTNIENLKKELLEETNLNLNLVDHRIMTQIQVDKVDRGDDRGRIITTAFLVQLPRPFSEYTLRAGDDAKAIETSTVDYATKDAILFADHAGIIHNLIRKSEMF